MSERKKIELELPDFENMKREEVTKVWADFCQAVLEAFGVRGFVCMQVGLPGELHGDVQDGKIWLMTASCGDHQNDPVIGFGWNMVLSGIEAGATVGRANAPLEEVLPDSRPKGLTPTLDRKHNKLPS